MAGGTRGWNRRCARSSIAPGSARCRQFLLLGKCDTSTRSKRRSMLTRGAWSVPAISRGALTRRAALLKMSAQMRFHQFATDAGYLLEARTLAGLTYVWALRPGQTPERLKQGITAIDRYRQAVPPPTDAYKANWLFAQSFLDLDSDTASKLAAENQTFGKEFKRFVF